MLEAIDIRLEAIASRLELEAIASRLAFKEICVFVIFKQKAKVARATFSTSWMLQLGRSSASRTLLNLGAKELDGTVSRIWGIVRNRTTTSTRIHFEDLSGELEFEEMVDGLLKCRGPVSKTDIIAIRLKCSLLIRMMNAVCEKLGIDP